MLGLYGTDNIVACEAAVGILLNLTADIAVCILVGAGETIVRDMIAGCESTVGNHMLSNS